MKHLLILLCLTFSLTAKIRLLSFHSDCPELALLQEQLFQKFMVDDYEWIVFNEADHPQLTHAQIVHLALERFGKTHDDIVATVNADFFPIRPVDLRELFLDVSRISTEDQPSFTAFDPQKVFDGKIKKYYKKNSSELHSFPKEQLVCFGFNDWESRIINALPKNYNLEFHIDNHFICLNYEISDSNTRKAKLKYMNMALKMIPPANLNQEADLSKIYEYYSKLPQKDSDIGEHLFSLKQLALECQRVIEIGLGSNINSTWGILLGLSGNKALHRSYWGIDIRQPDVTTFNIAREEAEKQGISFRFSKADDLTIEIEPADFLFIDSLHTYCHLTYELETFSPKIRKYIAMHDTSGPWGDADDDLYLGDYSEYPASYSRQKKGLWNAVVDFLAHHPEWELRHRFLNCNGLTILERIRD